MARLFPHSHYHHYTSVIKWQEEQDSVQDFTIGVKNVTLSPGQKWRKMFLPFSSFTLQMLMYVDGGNCHFPPPEVV